MVLYIIAVFLAKTLFGGLGRLSVMGRKNVPRNGPLVVVSNHMSNGDPPALVASLPRHLHIMAKRGVFAGPPVARILTSMGVYPLDRDGRDVKALIWSIRTLRRGEAVLFFPEGTRSLDAKMRRGRIGAAYAALKSGAPILPVGITGTENIPGLWTAAFPLCRMRVNIGEPFTLPEPEGPITREFLERTTDTIMERVAALLPERYRGYYGDGVRALHSSVEGG